jgi:hypothetical protein
MLVNNNKIAGNMLTYILVLSLLYKPTSAYPAVNQPFILTMSAKTLLLITKCTSKLVLGLLNKPTSLYPPVNHPSFILAMSAKTLLLITKCTSKLVLSLLYKPTLVYPAVNLSPSYSPCQLNTAFNGKI